MKKYPLLLIILSLFLFGCENRVKIKKTLRKTVTVPFSINTTGKFSSNSILTADQITNLFDPEELKNEDSRIEKFDVNSFNITGTINEQQNTASEVTVSAVVNSGGTTPLLNDTKLIRIGGNRLLQNLTDILNATTGDIKNEVSFANALLAINAVGVQKVQQIISENLKGINSSGLSIRLNGTVPEGQRLVGTITLTINATITFTRCETWSDVPFPIGMNEC